MGAIRYVDFGVPDVAAPHHVAVRIPQERNAPVEIWEDFGAVSSGESGNRFCRVVLRRDVWRAIAKPAQDRLNARLRERKLKPSKFVVGGWSRIDRILGRELIVLAWAAENMNALEAADACLRWVSLKPEELWWLFIKADEDAGVHNDPICGWRAALAPAFNKPPVNARRRLRFDDDPTLASSGRKRQDAA